MDIEISKIKARRGSNPQRLSTSLDQGELAYTLDTKRLFVGDGVTIGGSVVGNKVHPPLLNYYSLSSVVSEVGDLVPVNNFFYQLIYPDYTNLSNWQEYKFNINNTLFSFGASDTLTINQSSLSAVYINPSTVSNGIKISSGILQLDYQPKSLELSALKLSIKASGIDERELNSTTFYKGISGGSGTKVSLNVDSNYLHFDTNNKLTLSGSNPFTLRFSDLDATWFGSGLTHNPSVSTLSAYLANVDGVSLVRNTNGSIKIQDGITPSTTTLSKTTIDQFGRTTAQQSSIVSALTGSATTNLNNSLSAIFNGSIVSTVPGLNLTTFTAISSNGTTLTLSSAGFITFEGPSTTQEGQTIQRFAVPIFTY